MKGIFKEYIWPIVLIVLAGFLDVLLRNTSYGWLDILNKPISVNIIEIIIFTFSVVLFYKFIPRKFRKRAERMRAARLQLNWAKFKEILTRYKETKTDPQNQYDVLRKLIRKDLNYFMTDIPEILKKTGYEHEGIVINNFEACLTPEQIADWQQKVRREIPGELDCFDYIPAALVRHFDK